MKKILSVLLTLCLFVNVSFAFDPYADEEVEKKSYKKLYYGIALTLLGGFLAYDGFSEEEVDVSKPRVDYLTVSHSEWVQIAFIGQGTDENVYRLRSGCAENNVPRQSDVQDYTRYEIDDEIYHVEENVLYNNGNVDLRNIKIEVRYKYADGGYIGDGGAHITEGGYHTAGTSEDGKNIPTSSDNIYYKDIELKKGEYVPWRDIWEYSTAGTTPPNAERREPYYDPKEDPSHTAEIAASSGTAGLNLGKNSAKLMDVRVKLEKNKNYTPIYEKRHKSDLEGVAGIFVGLAGIYFIVDHFVDLHKFNVYAKKHNLNLRFATASNEYKLMLQKRI